ncbi:MAG TPA: DUF4331 family protein [Polyangiaceae bacterium]|jgi:hypothetical protein
MKRPIAIALTCACIAGLGATTRLARSADHLDSPATKADPTVDLNDLYSFMDGNSAVFAVTLFPAATTAAKFSDKVQYVIHTASGSAFGATTANEDIVCTFNTAQTIQCWAGTDEYVTGDASKATGLASADGKLKVFAGLRADPFFFNLDGFHHAVATVEGAASGLTFDTAGCPALDNGTAAALRSQLQTSLDGGAATDFFGPLNGLAIVVSIDKSLVTKGGAIVASWAGTYRTP